MIFDADGEVLLFKPVANRRDYIVTLSRNGCPDMVYDLYVDGDDGNALNVEERNDTGGGMDSNPK